MGCGFADGYFGDFLDHSFNSYPVYLALFSPIHLLLLADLDCPSAWMCVGVFFSFG
jgi:hypothetical protein